MTKVLKMKKARKIVSRIEDSDKLKEMIGNCKIFKKYGAFVCSTISCSDCPLCDSVGCMNYLASQDKIKEELQKEHTLTDLDIVIDKHNMENLEEALEERLLEITKERMESYL